MSLHLELALGDTLLVGDGTRIRLERKTGQRARLVIDSDVNVRRVKAGEPLPAASTGLTRQQRAQPDEPRPEPRPFLTRQTLPA